MLIVIIIESRLRGLDHSVNDFVLVIEFIEIVETVPPFEKKILTDQPEPWSKL